MNLLFIISIFSFLFGQLGRLSFYTQLININVYEIFLAFFCLILIFKYRLNPLRGLWKKTKVLFLFFGYFLFSYLINVVNYSWFENVTAFLYLLRLCLYGVFFVYSYHHLKDDKLFRKKIKNSIPLLIFIIPIISFIQYFFYPDLRNLYYEGWDPHLSRVFGLFFDTSIAGAIYGVLFLFLFIYRKNIVNNKIVRYIFLSIYFILSLLTYSRSLYISLIFIIVYYGYRTKKIIKSFLIVAIFLFGILIIPKPFGEGVNLKRVFTVESRFIDYSKAIELWKKKPIFGYGYNHIRSLKQEMVSHAGASFHSSYLIMLVSGGIIGLFLFLAILYKISTVNSFSHYAVLFLGILSLSDNILLHPFVIFLTGIFILLYNVENKNPNS